MFEVASLNDLYFQLTGDSLCVKLWISIPIQVSTDDWLALQLAG